MTGIKFCIWCQCENEAFGIEIPSGEIENGYIHQETRNHREHSRSMLPKLYFAENKLFWTHNETKIFLPKIYIAPPNLESIRSQETLGRRREKIFLENDQKQESYEVSFIPSPMYKLWNLDE